MKANMAAKHQAMPDWRESSASSSSMSYTTTRRHVRISTCKKQQSKLCHFTGCNTLPTCIITKRWDRHFRTRTMPYIQTIQVTIARAHLHFTLLVHTDGFICRVGTQDNSMASEVRQQCRIRRLRRPSVRWLSVLPLQTQQTFSIVLCLLQPLWHPNAMAKHDNFGIAWETMLHVLGQVTQSTGVLVDSACVAWSAVPDRVACRFHKACCPSR